VKRVIGGSYLEPIIAGVIAAFIVDLLRRCFKHLSLKKKWLLAFAGLISLLLLGAVGVQVYSIWAIMKLDVLHDDVLRTIGYALLAQFVLGFILLFAYKAQRRQYHGTFSILIPTSEERIEVRQFKQARKLSDADRLQLTWETFGDGLAILENQIRSSRSQYTPHLCVGVNPSGLLVATYLSGKIWDAMVPLGYVCIKKDDKEQPCFEHKSLPRTGPPVRSILVVDSEIKSGKNLQYLAEELKKQEHYGENIQLRYAAMWACRVEEKIKTMTELRTKGLYEVTSDDYLPRYLAFTAPSRVWKPGRIH